VLLHEEVLLEVVVVRQHLAGVVQVVQVLETGELHTVLQVEAVRNLPDVAGVEEQLCFVQEEVRRGREVVVDHRDSRLVREILDYKVLEVQHWGVRLPTVVAAAEVDTDQHPEVAVVTALDHLDVEETSCVKGDLELEVQMTRVAYVVGMHLLVEHQVLHHVGHEHRKVGEVDAE